MADHFDVQKHIVAAAPDIGKAKSLGFVKPFHPRGLNRQIQKLIRRQATVFFAQGHRHTYSRLDLDHDHRLLTARGGLGLEPNRRAIRDRALAIIAQNIGVKQNIRPAVLGHDESKSLDGIEPFHMSKFGFTIIDLVRHSRDRSLGYASVYRPR